jgi:hypothetical protein
MSQTPQEEEDQEDEEDDEEDETSIATGKNGKMKLKPDADPIQHHRQCSIPIKGRERPILPLH